MESIAINLLRCTTKLVNFAMAIAGIPMVLYGIWMVSVWYRNIEDPSSSAWFIYTFLSIGIALCFITCLGHISADCSNSFCLSCYSVIIIVLIFLETVAAEILVNPDWEKHLPEDPTGRFQDFKLFVRSNFDFFKWVFLLILLAQGSSVVLAMALRGLGANYRSKHKSDGDHLADNLPLIDHRYEPPYVLDN